MQAAIDHVALAGANVAQRPADGSTAGRLSKNCSPAGGEAIWPTSSKRLLRSPVAALRAGAPDGCAALPAGRNYWFGPETARPQSDDVVRQIRKARNRHARRTNDASFMPCPYSAGKGTAPNLSYHGG